MFDIDFFKNFNDTYGHQAGDECLKRIGFLLAKNRFSSRPGDLVARYGGEEFVLVLSSTNKSEALFILRKMCKAILDEKIPHKNTKVYNCNFVTASVGLVSEVPRQNSSPKQLIAKADEALYKAKAQGRNQIEIYVQSFSNVMNG